MDSQTALFLDYVKDCVKNNTLNESQAAALIKQKGVNPDEILKADCGIASPQPAVAMNDAAEQVVQETTGVAVALEPESDSYKDIAPLFPSELKKLKRWIVRDKNKLPYSPYPEDDNHGTVDSQDEQFQGQYQDALGAFEDTKKYAGIGFVFNYADGLTGVDFDNCVNPDTLEIRPDIREIIEKVDSYTEITQSKTGIHIHTKGWQFPIGPEGQQGMHVGKAEMYSGGRYFAVTGLHVEGTPFTVESRDLSWLYERIKKREFVTKVSEDSQPNQPGSSCVIERKTSVISSKFETLTKGTITRSKDTTKAKDFVIEDDNQRLIYQSQSDADMALLRLLLNKNNDVEVVKSEFMKSPLGQRKKAGRDGYLDATIKKLQASQQTNVSDILGEEIGIEEELLPEFPRFSGSLAELASVICPDIPWEFKFMAAVTHWGLMRSGLDSLENEHLQPRLYCCFVKEPGFGKTAAINEVRNFMRMITSRYCLMSSVDSGPSLVDEFKDQSSKASLLGDSCSRVLLDVDEMKDLFEKSKVTAGNRNSLSTELLKLFETNITGNRARSSKRGKIEVTNAHLAILGGATTRGYEMMWTGTGGGATGLQSRFTLVTTSAPRMPIQKAPTDMVKVVEVLERIRSQAERPEQVISLTSEALKVLADWWARTSRDRESESRVDDAVKRLLIVLAATNDINTIGPGMVQQACQFGDYLIACREKFNPADSHSWTQAFENAILKVAVARNVAMTRNEFRQRVNPTQKAGGLGPFIQAWNNVVTSGMLKQDGATQKGTAKYRARPEKTVVK